MTNEQRMVLEFHKKFGCLRHDAPTHLTTHEQINRLRRMREEFEEVRAAMEEGSLAHIAQELADLLYTVYGTAVAYGIDLEPVYREVHNANMRKEGGGTANDGKILKPATWTPPDIETIIQAQVIAAHLVTSDGDDTEYVRNNPWLMHQIDASQQTYQGQP